MKKNAQNILGVICLMIVALLGIASSYFVSKVITHPFNKYNWDKNQLQQLDCSINTHLNRIEKILDGYEINEINKSVGSQFLCGQSRYGRVEFTNENATYTLIIRYCVDEEKETNNLKFNSISLIVKSVKYNNTNYKKISSKSFEPIINVFEYLNDFNYFTSQVTYEKLSDSIDFARNNFDSNNRASIISTSWDEQNYVGASISIYSRAIKDDYSDTILLNFSMCKNKCGLATKSDSDLNIDFFNVATLNGDKYEN